jgi:phosphoribosylformylglycinamidine synthase PurS subunit
MKIGIKIMPRDVILDSQGRAVEQSLTENGFSQLKSCRIGKFIELDLNATQDEAAKMVEKMLNEGGLYNPLIEKFEIQNSI